MSNLIYPVRNATGFFKRAEAISKKHLASPLQAGPGDLIGVHLYINETQLEGVSAWTARSYVTLDEDGSAQLVSYTTLPENLKSDAAQISMGLMFEKPEHAQDFYAQMDILRKTSAATTLQKTEGMTYSLLIMRGVAYLASTHLDNGKIFEDMFRNGNAQKAIDDHRCILVPSAQSAHDCVNLMQDYSPEAIATYNDAISCVAEKGRMACRVQPIGLPDVAEIISTSFSLRADT